MNTNRVFCNARNIAAWLGVAVAITDAVPQLHHLRGVVLAVSGAILAVEHNTQTEPKMKKVKP